MEIVEDIDTIISNARLGPFQWILLFVLGSHAACYGFQIMNISILGPILYCKWRLNTFQLVAFTDIVYIGMMIGCLVLGRFSDNYGRKTCLLLSEFGLMYSGLMSTLAPDIYWMSIMQFVSGFFSAGILLSVYPLMSELTPTEYRGIIIPLLDIFSGFGYLAVTLFSYLSFSFSDWRYFLFIPSVLIIILLLSLLWLPESPRFLLVNNEKMECLNVLNRIAKMNKSELVSDVQDLPVNGSSFRDLIHPNYLSTTILSSFLTFVCFFNFYSMNLIIVFINGRNSMCLQKQNRNFYSGSSNRTDVEDNSCCTEMTWSNYETILITNLAQIIAIPILIVFINLIGRKRTFAVFLMISLVGILILNLCLEYLHLTILLFFLRGTVTALRTLCIIYLTEVYPTSIRSLGMGIGKSFGRFSAVLTPIIVNIIMERFSFIGGTIILCLFSFGAFIASYFLPYETKFRHLHDTVSEVSYGTKKYSTYGSFYNK